MKTKHLVIIILVALSIAIMGAICACIYAASKIESFSLDDYVEFIDTYNDYFPAEEKPEPFGQIDSAEKAKDIAELIWKEVYGDSIINGKLYRVSFDEENEVWLVQGSFLLGFRSGPYILIQKSDGKAIAIWNEKF